MSNKQPKIISFKPIVLEDNRRVILAMVVEGLATPASNNMLLMPDLPGEPPSAGPPKQDPDAPSPYPNVELSILNSRRQQLASLFIVEHKEKHTDLTLHLPHPEPQEQYTARAEMTYNEEIIDVIEAPFELNQVK